MRLIPRADYLACIHTHVAKMRYSFINDEVLEYVYQGFFLLARKLHISYYKQWIMKQEQKGACTKKKLELVGGLA